MSQPLFHLSIPADDLEATRQWYVEALGCGVGRRSVHALILDLGGHQLVAQKQPPQHNHAPQVGIYPRHFGLVFRELATWQALCDRVRAAGLSFAVEPKLRFAGDITEHHTFFLVDPSGNWLEFKHYSHPEAVLGCHEVAVVGDDSQRAEPQRLRTRLLEFLKFRVLAALREVDADCRHAVGVPPATSRTHVAPPTSSWGFRLQQADPAATPSGCRPEWISAGLGRL